MHRMVLSVALIVLMTCVSAYSQVPVKDSVHVVANDSLRPILRPLKSPGTALLLSAILPGAGQWYNESYWKVPVVVGVGAYFVAQWFNNNKRYHDYRDQYAASLTSSTVNTQVQDYYLQLREFYKDQRNSFVWYYLILYMVNLVDAYVDASLYGFDVSGDLSLRPMPASLPSTPQIGLTLRYRF